MTITEIPASYMFTCDACHKEHRQKSNGRPTGWHIIRWEADALDYQGTAVASAGFTRLLCPDCGASVRNAINSVVKQP